MVVARPKPKARSKPSRIPEGWVLCPRCGHLVPIPLCDGCKADQDPHGVFGDE